MGLSKGPIFFIVCLQGNVINYVWLQKNAKQCKQTMNNIVFNIIQDLDEIRKKYPPKR